MNHTANLEIVSRQRDDNQYSSCALQFFSFFLLRQGRGSCLLEVGRLLTFPTLKVDVYSRWCLIEVWNEHAKYTVKQASKVVMIPIYDEVQYNNFAHNPQKFLLQNSIRPICFQIYWITTPYFHCIEDIALRICRKKINILIHYFGLEKQDQYQCLGNCPPTLPLTQH